MWLTQQAAPPLSSVEQADQMDDIGTIFSNLVQSVKAFSVRPPGDFKHPLGRNRASSSPARGAQDRAPDGHARGRDTAKAHPVLWQPLQRDMQGSTQGGM